MAGSDTVLRSFVALIEAEEEVAIGFLLAGLYVSAIRNDETPRNVLDTLFKALPTDDAWPGLRRALLELDPL